MGYSIDIIDANFEIKSENTAQALQIVIDASKSYAGYDMDDATIKKISCAQSLNEALKEYKYEVDYDDKGNVVNISFTGCNYDEEIKSIFKAIAPTIKDGSFIDIRGEDGTFWKWTFNAGELTEKGGEIVYSD